MMATFHQVMTKGQSCDPALCDLATCILHWDSTHDISIYRRNMNDGILTCGTTHRSFSWGFPMSTSADGTAGTQHWLGWVGWLGNLRQHFNEFQRIDIVGVQFCNVSGDQKI